MAQCKRCGREISRFNWRRICVWCKQHEAAQRGEETLYQPAIRQPWTRREAATLVITPGLFGLNVAVFLGMLLSGGSPMRFGGDLLLSWGANYAPYTLTGEWWRLATAMFVHGSLLHLAINMWCLWSLGELAERLYGRVTFACVYILCGLAGSLASLWWHQPPQPSVGASGAIFGLAGALIASLYLSGYRGPVLVQTRMQGLVVFVLYNVLFGLVSRGTDNACHLGGLAAGLVLGVLIAKLAPRPMPWSRLGIAALLAALVGAGYHVIELRRAPRYYVGRAQQAIEAGDIDRASGYLAAATKLRPEMKAVSHATLAVAWAGRNSFNDAESEMQQAVAAAPANLNFRLALGELQVDAGQWTAARHTYAALVQEDPQNAAVHLGLARAAEGAGDSASAIDEYKKTLTLDARLDEARQALQRLQKD